MALDIKSWERLFQELIQEKKPRARWTLKLDEKLQPGSVALGWKQYQQRAFGSFQCSSCQRRWASSQVQVLCHMYLEPRISQGKVLMRHFGQRCKKCSRSRFEKPEFSSQSAMRILCNLVQRVLERCYSSFIRTVSEIPVIPEVPLDGSHDTVNCEACSLRVCVWGSRSLVTNQPTSPLPCLESGSSLPAVGGAFIQKQARKQSSEKTAAQGSGCNYIHRVSGPSHATGRVQVPEGGSRATQGTGPLPIRVAGSLPTGWADTQPKQKACLSHTNSQAAGKAAPQTTHQGSAPQTKRGSATQGFKLQAARGSNAQVAGRAALEATHGSAPQTKERSACRAKWEPVPQAAGTVASQATHQRPAPQATQGPASQATQGLDPQVTWALVAGKTAPQATHGAAILAAVRSAPQATRGSHPKATRRLDTQSAMKSAPQVTQGSTPKATQRLDTQAVVRLTPQATQGSHPQASQRLDTQAAERPAPQATQGSQSQATQGAAPQASMRSAPLVTEGSTPKATQRLDTQAAVRSAPQVTQGSTPKATQRFDTQAVVRSAPQATQGSHPQATQGAAPQAARKAVSQATQEAGPQAKQGLDPQVVRRVALKTIQGLDSQGALSIAPQATGRTDTQAPWKTDSKNTCGTGPTATRGSGTSSGTQAPWPVTTPYAFGEPRSRVVSKSGVQAPRRSSFTRETQERSSPRRHSPNGMSNDYPSPSQRLLWGCVCVAALFAFIAIRYL